MNQLITARVIFIQKDLGFSSKKRCFVAQHRWTYPMTKCGGHRNRGFPNILCPSSALRRGTQCHFIPKCWCTLLNWLVILTILKNISQWEGLIITYMKWKIKNVPNHQPVKLFHLGHSNNIKLDRVNLPSSLTSFISWMCKKNTNMCQTVMWCNLLNKVLQRKLVHKICRKITGNAFTYQNWH